MSTPVGVLAPINGQRISSFGGVLAFKAFGSGSPAALVGGGVPSISGAYTLDCAAWALDLISIHDDDTDTGSFGAANSQKTAEDWILHAQIIWDLRRPPELISKNGLAAGLDNFNAGFQLWAFLGDDANYPSDIGAQYYWAPSGKILQQKPIVDAAGKKMIRMELSIKGNSRIFRLPAESQQMGRYMAALHRRSLVF